MVANRFSLLVLCFSDWFFFPSEVHMKDLWSTFYVKEAMGKRSEQFFLTFVSRPVPFIYIPPTGNECGQKPIAMYVISGHSWRCFENVYPLSGFGSLAAHRKLSVRRQCSSWEKQGQIYSPRIDAIGFRSGVRLGDWSKIDKNPRWKNPAVYALTRVRDWSNW